MKEILNDAIVIHQHLETEVVWLCMSSCNGSIFGSDSSNHDHSNHGNHSSSNDSENVNLNNDSDNTNSNSGDDDRVMP